MGYARSPFRDFERCFRYLVGLDEDDLPLVLKQYISNFITYEIPAGKTSNIVFSEAAYKMGDHD